MLSVAQLFVTAPRQAAGVLIFDNFLADPVEYRKEALDREFKSYEFPECTFHGISPVAVDSLVPSTLRDIFDHTKPTLSFFRKSPAGQVEPHFIHSDIDMGQWSAILYLNENPPAGDGTAFWQHKATGKIGSRIPHEYSAEGKTPDGWSLRYLAEAKFNRLVAFPSSFFHSRAIFENWGAGDEARLTQVTFGEGSL